VSGIRSVARPLALVIAATGAAAAGTAAEAKATAMKSLRGSTQHTPWERQFRRRLSPLRSHHAFNILGLQRIYLDL
jgi:hypothetical protein